MWKFAASFFLNEAPCLPIKKKREKVTLASKEKKLFFIKRERERERGKVIPKKTKNIRAFKSIRVFSQTKKKSIRVKVFVYYNIRIYFFLIFVNVLILMIVYIIKLLGICCWVWPIKRKSYPGYLWKFVALFFFS